jgi:ABC-type dipeptide/oligopeptide/nickel transport system ATPase component
MSNNIFLDVARSHVILVAGKRGSGKSYTLGVITEEIAKKAHLSDNEFKVALGVLKKKAYIEITNGSIALNAKKEEISKKFLEENFLEELPLVESKLTSEQFEMRIHKRLIDILQSCAKKENFRCLGS